MSDFNVVVLGGGTAGVHVATAVGRTGKSAALVEAGLIGGESPYLAGLPAQALLLSAARGQTWAAAVARRDLVTGGLDDSAAERELGSAGVTVFRGTGRVAGPGQLVVIPRDGGEAVSLGYTDLVIATGSEPVAPPIEGLADISAWTTAEALSADDLPRRLIVLGGGPAGCELAQLYAAFGSKVTLVEAADRLLPAEPAFAGHVLAAALRRAGVEIYLGSPAAKAERTPDGLTLALADGTRIDANRLLLATGRRPRLSNLGLEKIGVTALPGTAPPTPPVLPTTTTCQVADKDGEPVADGHVWAAGDVTGVGHTHAGQYQARMVAANLTRACGTAEAGTAEAADGLREADYSAIPRVVFTTPEVFGVGVNPADGAEVVTGRASLAGTARARASGDSVAGYLELYADPRSGVLVGAAAVGPDAGSWMGEVTLAIRAKIPVEILADVVHAFPAYGEALEAALAVALRELAASASTQETEREVSRLSEMDMETPEGDAIEQRQELFGDIEDENAVGTGPRRVPFDVDEADAAEQDRSVGFDDDDYR
jgi:dihydrolipoamide dehydrogenase